ncbi:hypothetical protein M153_11200012749 [Pseudoloma neurophilia]|uniref:Uncharacterized protein n=1 Tax=Pseudoloma neurophilia TaxID=146866 RepID=A0A0R0M028_9MICR|nr:hypothetical protein M153_11200012749 [Pseudoloma neurophilia]
MDFIKTYEAVTSFVKRLVYVETSIRLTITIDGRLAGVGGVVTLAVRSYSAHHQSKEVGSGNVLLHWTKYCTDFPDEPDQRLKSG